MFFKNKKRYTVYTYGAEVLKQTAAPIAEITDETRNVAAMMLKAVKIFGGIGLAGPQVGISQRIVILDVPQDGVATTPGEAMLLPRMPMVVINPEIISHSGELLTKDEGCLSVPEIYAPVERPAVVRVEATTLDGEKFDCECGGLLGRCFQHEIDHLNGVVFVDRVKKEDYAEISSSVKRLVKRGKKNDFKKSVMR